jgi:hypothetical protein
VIQKEVEKILKYKDLTTEIQLMWNVKTRVIIIIIIIIFINCNWVVTRWQ